MFYVFLSTEQCLSANGSLWGSLKVSGSHSRGLWCIQVRSLCLEMLIRIRVFKGDVSCHKTPQGIQEDGGERDVGSPRAHTDEDNRTPLPPGGRGFANVKGPDAPVLFAHCAGHTMWRVWWVRLQALELNLLKDNCLCLPVCNICYYRFYPRCQGLYLPFQFNRQVSMVFSKASFPIIIFCLLHSFTFYCFNSTGGLILSGRFTALLVSWPEFTFERSRQGTIPI